MTRPQISDRLAERFDALSPTLQTAARFAMQHPEEVALQSMRAIAAAAGVAPTSMVRLAQELGYGTYEAFREEYRAWMRDGHNPLSGRLLTLQGKGRHRTASKLIDTIVQRELANASRTISRIGPERLVEAQRRLSSARRVHVLGYRSHYVSAFYFHYMCQTFTSKTVLLDGAGGTAVDGIRTIDKRDLLLVFSINPYARDAVRVVEFAHAKGVPILAVTDDLASPVARKASQTLLVSNAPETMTLTSVVPSLLLAQLLVTLMIATSGGKGAAAIAASARQLVALDVYYPTR